MMLFAQTPVPLPPLPQWMVVGGIILFIVGAVVLIWGLLAGVTSLLAQPAGEPTLADRAEEIRPARGPFERIDGRFARLVRGTMFGLTPEAGLGWILLVGSISAVVAYIITPDIFLALLALVVGGFIPFFTFMLFSGRRKRAIQEQLPDGCFQLARSLRSGLALPSALRETANYLPMPLAELFERLSTAITLGESTTAALDRVAADARVTEFDLLTAVIATNIRSGGNLPAMLDRLASSIRDRNQYRGYFRSVTALSRISGFFLALAGPIVAGLWMIFQPDLFMKFVNATFGQILIAFVVVLELACLVWLLWLLRGQERY